MKTHRLTLSLVALLLSALSAQATITINLGAQFLYNASGTQIPMGALIQLVVSTTDDTFTPVSPTSFTGGSADDMVLASFGASSPGTGSQAVMFSLAGNLNATDNLLLRWFPTLTTGSAQPGSNTQYGEFRSDGAPRNFSDIDWNVPNDGTTNTLNFLTMAASGQEAEAEGRADLLTVPEPSSIVLAGLGALGLVGILRRRAKR
jgi:PEP-CTERM motif